MSYVGNKNIPGVIELLVNNLPKSKRYFSLFFGSGGLETSKYTDKAMFVCSEKNEDCKKYQTNTAVVDFLDYKALIDNFVFDGQDFVFADPPYTFLTRRSGKKYYKFEFNTKEHVEFLKYMVSLDAKIMITHPKDELYKEYLKDWTSIEFSYQSHKGTFNDCLWMNYNTAEIELLNYDALGHNFTERQAIKRQRRNMINKFKKMDLHVRRKILEEINNNCSI